MTAPTLTPVSPSPSTRPLLDRFGATGRLLRRAGGVFGILVVLTLVVLALVPDVAPYGPATQEIENRLQGPSLDHPFGTDHLGRDLLSRLVFGVRIELSVALPAIALALVCGLVLGLVAGYVGRWLDTVIVTLVDTIQSFPAVILALVLLVLLGPSTGAITLVLAIGFIPSYARTSRALMLATKENPYVEAERSIGAGPVRIITVHILPNMIAPVFILLAMDLPSVIAIEAGLSFLGLGIQPPTPSWGVILSDGFQYIRQSPWAIVAASGVLVVTTLGLTLLGEALRDTLDPRLARLTGRGRP
ncbi:MAG: ABC transporter permease subunit [Streptosporangiales bacterium]|nr:ABC transporter permease subunit [Streptosporangiales bacterium]